MSGTNYYHTLAVCPPAVSNITLPSTTKTIGTQAFYGCEQLVNVSMNDEVTRIESSAFFLCSSLEFIELPGTVSYIGRRAFNGCGKLKRVFYCGDSNADYSEGDPFPDNPDIYSFYTFQDGDFCGHSVQAILDLQCKILAPTAPMPTPTHVFTAGQKYMFCRSVVGRKASVYLLHYLVLDK